MSMPNPTETSRLIRLSRKPSKRKNAPILIALFKWKTLLIFGTNGAMDYACEKFQKEPALKLSIKRSEKYSVTMNWIRTRLTFSIFRSASLCLRDTRVGFYVPLAQHFEFACADAHIL